MTVVAQDWPVLSLTGDSAGALGLVTALRFTPLLLTLWAGGPADRYDKRRLLPAANTASGALAAVLALLTATGRMQPWHAYAFAPALGTAGPLVAWWGTGPVTALNAAGHPASAVGLWLIRPAELLRAPARAAPGAGRRPRLRRTGDGGRRRARGDAGRGGGPEGGPAVSLMPKAESKRSGAHF
jgi:hypothetical protein